MELVDVGQKAIIACVAFWSNVRGVWQSKLLLADIRPCFVVEFRYAGPPFVVRVVGLGRLQTAAVSLQKPREANEARLSSGLMQLHLSSDRSNIWKWVFSHCHLLSRFVYLLRRGSRLPYWNVRLIKPALQVSRNSPATRR